MADYARYLNTNPDAVQALRAGFPQPQQPQPAGQAQPYAALDGLVRPEPVQPQPNQPEPEPAPVAVPAATPEPSQFTPVQAPKARTARAALREIQDQQVGIANDMGASFVREGAAKSKAAEERAGVAAEASTRLNRYADAAEKNADDNRIMQNEGKQWLRDDMKKLREPPLEKTGWQKATSALTGIVGMVAQGWLGPGAGDGVAFGLQALDNHVSQNIFNQLSEKDQAGHNLEHTSKYLDTIGKDSNSELEVAGKLAANHWFATERELESIAERAKSPAEKEAALRLAKKANLEGLNIYEGMTKDVLAEQRAAAAARARALAAGPQWDNMDPSVLEQLESQGKLPLAGLNALNESRKKAREAKGDQDTAVGGEIFPGYVQSQALLASSDAKARTIYSAGASIKSDLARLAEMRRKNGGGTWNRDDVKEAKGIIATLPSRYSQMFGSGAPNNTELELFGSYLTDPTDYQLTGLDPEESYRRLAAQVDRTAEAQLGGFGIKRRPNAGITFTPEGAGNVSPAPRSPAQSQAPAQPVAPQTFNMIDKTGRLHVVPAARVQAAKNSGFYIDPEIDPTVKRAPPPAPAPAPDPYAPQDYDAEENQRVLAALGGG